MFFPYLHKPGTEEFFITENKLWQINLTCLILSQSGPG